MMKKLIYTVMLSATFLLTGCQEAKYQLFDDIARVKMVTAGEEIFADFYYRDESVTRDTVYFSVNVMGGPENRERKIGLKQISEFDVAYKYDAKGNLIDSVLTEKPHKAVPGVHYVGMDEAEMQALLVVKPNVVLMKVPIILLRDSSLQTNEYRLCLELVETSDFQLGERSKLSGTIVFSDKLSKPSFWNKVVEDWTFGKYSLRKHEFMIEVIQTEINDAWYKKLSADLTEETYVVSKLKDALTAYNTDPENIAKGLAPMRENQNDPDSPLILFP